MVNIDLTPSILFVTYVILAAYTHRFLVTHHKDDFQGLDEQSNRNWAVILSLLFPIVWLVWLADTFLPEDGEE